MWKSLHKALKPSLLGHCYLISHFLSSLFQLRVPFCTFPCGLLQVALLIPLSCPFIYQIFVTTGLQMCSSTKAELHLYLSV